MLFSNIIGHTKTVLKHKYYVFMAMKDCGRPIRGLLHDLSKFSVTEFRESIKYYQQGTRSPIDAAREAQGYSLAWFHHRGRNKHHSQYWVDISFGEIIPAKIPYEILIEHICDTIGAGKAYMKDEWSEAAPINYWNYRECKSFYHKDTYKFLEFIYKRIYDHGWDFVSMELSNNTFRDLYNKGCDSI